MLVSCLMPAISVNLFRSDFFQEYISIAEGTLVHNLHRYVKEIMLKMYQIEIKPKVDFFAKEFRIYC